jgi:hypothetical protein
LQGKDGDEEGPEAERQTENGQLAGEKLHVPAASDDAVKGMIAGGGGWTTLFVAAFRQERSRPRRRNPQRRDKKRRSRRGRTERIWRGMGG